MPISHTANSNEPAEESVSHHQDRGAGLLALARHLSALKTVQRTGWRDRGVDAPAVESVADHSFAVALLAWAAALERAAEGMAIDPARVLILALLHDLAEAATGDLPPYDPQAVPDLSQASARRAFLNERHHRGDERAAAKRAAEDAAMDEILAHLPVRSRSTLSAVWDELRHGDTTEARFVKQVDRLETYLQSRFYLEHQPELPMDSFHTEVIETVDDPILCEVRDAAPNARSG